MVNMKGKKSKAVVRVGVETGGAVRDAATAAAKRCEVACG